MHYGLVPTQWVVIYKLHWASFPCVIFTLGLFNSYVIYSGLSEPLPVKWILFQGQPFLLLYAFVVPLLKTQFLTLDPVIVSQGRSTVVLIWSSYCLLSILSLIWMMLETVVYGSCHLYNICTTFSTPIKTLHILRSVSDFRNLDVTLVIDPLVPNLSTSASHVEQKQGVFIFTAAY